MSSIVLNPSGAPASPSEGEVYYDSTADKLKVRDSSAFREVVTQDATFNGTIGSSATFASALFNKGNDGYLILPSGIEIKWGITGAIASFGGGNTETHTYTSDQGGAFGTATLWGIVWIGDRTSATVATAGSNGSIAVYSSNSSISFKGLSNLVTGSNVKYLFLAIGH